MEITMYDTLLQLPLFQGLCKDDFTAIIERVKFHFCTYAAGETIVSQGEACSQLVFLLNGSLISHTTDEKSHYQISETFDTLHIIEPYSLFGMKTCYTATYQAQTPVKVLAIDKSFILSELINYEIFRINYLNILSNRCQMTRQILWETHIGTLQEKFINFLLTRCQKSEGAKTLQITMEDLSRLINETRINVSRFLNECQKKGLLTLKRKEICIPALEKLSEVLQ